jgi:hypothetical protein
MNATSSRKAQSHVPDLAPSDLPRQRRRHINRALHKLIERGVYSICNCPPQHNTRTAYGLDAHGRVMVAGECCLDRLAVIFGLGFFSKRKYDFLTPAESDAPQSTNEKIAEGIAFYQKAIAEADERIDSTERYGGINRITRPVFAEHPWKTDDRIWFEQNPTRSHRMRQLFPGEADEEAAETPPDHAPIMLVRQVQPGDRVRALVFIPGDMLMPLPLNKAQEEALVYALFEIALGHEPMPRSPQAFSEPRDKYAARNSA